MAKFNVFTLVGGISNASINKRLYAEIVKHHKGNLSFQMFDVASLPFYSQDIENDPPPTVKSMKEAAKRSDAVLIITPEYNRSIPGVLKNAIDWGSRPYGSSCWTHKPAAVMGASGGNIGTFGAQQHLRNICSYLNMHLMGQPEFYFNASVNMPETGLTESAVKLTDQFFTTFEEWIKIFVKK